MKYSTCLSKINLFPVDLISQLELNSIIPKEIFISLRNRDDNDIQEDKIIYLEILRHDDLDKLIVTACIRSDPCFDINMEVIIIEYSYFEKFNLIQIAASYSAIQCFRYLVIN